MVPAAYGGRSEQLDPLAICVAREALMATSSHADSLFALQGIGSYAITMAGTPEQRALWLPRVARFEALAALALTEPDAGSDLKMVSTELVTTGDGLLLRGSKSFISNGKNASFYTVFAKEGAGFSMVLVPAGTAGVSVTATPELIAPHELGEIAFKDVVLPHSARLGVPGKVSTWCSRRWASSACPWPARRSASRRPRSRRPSDTRAYDASSAARSLASGPWPSCWQIRGRRSRWRGS